MAQPQAAPLGPGLPRAVSLGEVAFPASPTWLETFRTDLTKGCSGYFLPEPWYSLQRPLTARFGTQSPPVGCCWKQPPSMGVPLTPCIRFHPTAPGHKSFLASSAMPKAGEPCAQDVEGEGFWGLVWRLRPWKAASVWEEAPLSPFVPPLVEALSWAGRHHGHSHGNSRGAVPAPRAPRALPGPLPCLGRDRVGTVGWGQGLHKCCRE